MIFKINVAISIPKAVPETVNKKYLESNVYGPYAGLSQNHNLLSSVRASDVVDDASDAITIDVIHILIL